MTLDNPRLFEIQGRPSNRQWDGVRLGMFQFPLTPLVNKAVNAFHFNPSPQDWFLHFSIKKQETDCKQKTGDVKRVIKSGNIGEVVEVYRQMI